jgi:hypothetical protein
VTIKTEPETSVSMDSYKANVRDLLADILLMLQHLRERGVAIPEALGQQIADLLRMDDEGVGTITATLATPDTPIVFSERTATQSDVKTGGGATNG